jgi:hypothetical protein
MGSCTKGALTVIAVCVAACTPSDDVSETIRPLRNGGNQTRELRARRLGRSRRALSVCLYARGGIDLKSHKTPRKATAHSETCAVLCCPNATKRSPARSPTANAAHA